MTAESASQLSPLTPCEILIEKRATALFNRGLKKIAKRTDYQFLFVLLFQWGLAIVFAYLFAPRSIALATLVGLTLTGFAYFWVSRSPGSPRSRCAVTFAQMGFSSLLIHLTGGRIETHFHIFVSMAFLSFYRDFRPLFIATLLTLVDQWLRGAYIPVSIYGAAEVPFWKPVEHVTWLALENVFLIINIQSHRKDLKFKAKMQAELELTLAHQERLVTERTRELQEAQQKMIEQQSALMAHAKLSSLGEMAGGIAHEINTPLAIIGLKVGMIESATKKNNLSEIDLLQSLHDIQNTTDRIAGIVKSLRRFFHGQNQEPTQNIELHALINETLELCKERYKNHGIEIRREFYPEPVWVRVRPIEVSQIILNLLNNAFDSIKQKQNPWITIKTLPIEDRIHLKIIDCGSGIPAELVPNLMQPFFTTKAPGQGTGLGLSISKKLAEANQASLKYELFDGNTCFDLEFSKPTHQPQTREAS